MSEVIAPRFRMVRTTKEFLYWFDKARPGDTIVYHVGDLPYDRIGGSAEAKAIEEVAATAFEFARTSELHLLQARVGAGVFEYRAVKTSPKNMTKLTKWLLRPIKSAHGVQPLHTRKMPPLLAQHPDILEAV